MIITDGGRICRGVRFIFIHVYKCGGTSVRTALMKYNSAALISKYGLSQHASAREVRDKLGPVEWSRYVSFAVIRNPWDRHVSRYYYNRHITNIMPLEQYLPDARAAHLSQTDFVCDEHGRVLVTHLLRFEHLEHDLNAVLTRIGLPAVHLPHLNLCTHPPFQNMYDAVSWEEQRMSPDAKLWLLACTQWGEDSAQKCLFGNNDLHKTDGEQDSVRQ